MKAFPRADMKFNSLVSDELGMDLRDYFAAKVLQAFESRKDLDVVPIIDIAKRSYAIADAMMKARTE